MKSNNKKDNNTQVPVVILCGGLGTRMKEETEYRPKPMVEVAGKPLLWHIMKIYNHFGYNRFILALGYKGNYIKDFFIKQNVYISNFTFDTATGETDIHSHNNEDNFKITFVDTGNNTLTGERILKLRDYINSEDFMVTYGDGLANINIPELLKYHKNKKTIGTITGVNPSSRFGLVNINEGGFVTGFEQKPKLHDFVNGGFMIFNKSIFNYLQPGDMIEHAFLRLVKEKQLSLYPHKDFWFCIDTIRDLEEANRLWNEEDAPWAIWEKELTSNKEEKIFSRETTGQEFLSKIHEK